MRGWRPARRTKIVGAVISLFVAVGGFGTAFAARYLTDPAGFPAGISALRTLPAVPLPESIPPVAVGAAAAYVGVPIENAETRLRRLRSGSQGDLYAFQAEDASVCLFLAPRLGTCLRADHFVRLNVPGVFPAISPGYPDEQPVLVAVVADDVRRAWVVTASDQQAASIRNNAIYATLAGSGSDRIDLEVEYESGKRKLVPVQPGGD